jgi:cell wall-associated NlpC family hydrolase
MARISAEAIYAACLHAGFSPDRATTMTAIALAESGGRTDANLVNDLEDSKGLWQINSKVHPQFAGWNLNDPEQNARAAFQLSHGGDDISPWTTTHTGRGAAKYLRFKADAQAAAVANGQHPDLGMWSGTSGYKQHVSAGDPSGGGQQSQGHAPTDAGSDNVNLTHAATTTANPAADALHAGEEWGIQPVNVDSMGKGHGLDIHAGEEWGIQPVGATGTPGTPGTPGTQGTPADPNAPSTMAPTTQPATTAPAVTAPATNTLAATTTVADPAHPAPQNLAGGDPTKLDQFLHTAVAQTGDHYVFGHEVNLDDPNPNTFDCSELVEWSTHQVGVKMPDGAWNQYEFLRKGGHMIPVDQAIHTPGALLFSFSSDPDQGHPKANHVAISLGDGKTIEAKGTQYGVGSWEANTKRFNYAAVIPELSGTAGATPMPVTAAAPTTQPPVDSFQYRLTHDPVNMDSHPATMIASHALTDAGPPPAGVVVDDSLGNHGQPPPVYFDDSHDLNHDGMDDALQHATDYSAAQDDHGIHPIDHGDHHFDDHHDATAH